MRALFAAVALSCAIACASPADARPRHYRGSPAVDHVAGANGRPAGCPVRLWCGCYLMKRFGLDDRALWQARRWALIGRRAPGPAVDVIAVWPHHVGVITADLGGGLIRVLSGNDSNAVRDRVRSTRGIIAYRYLH